MQFTSTLAVKDVTACVEMRDLKKKNSWKDEYV